MNCENCKYWQFPTSSLYQNIHTMGYCTLNDKMTKMYPDGSCDAFVFETKPPALHAAVRRARGVIMKQKFGDIMNSDTEITRLQSEIDERQGRVDLLKRGNPRNHGNITANPATDTYDGLPRLTESAPSKPTDMYTVKFIQPMKLFARTQDERGDVVEMVFRKPNGRLLVVSSAECEVTQC